ncbi:hypothetical protein EDD80_12013 [Anseongella ginsenosidimutans]|uniref:DUF3800 domain-containing protein n=1 Tax=Anseongella ginsenosidimutans TaxID=496056 RepID=A0A4R3KL22_9SPHI|nr:DUF3800 domain-containing protein [Anseongella ginsenosidimutans]QEC53577.1 DUF3800 domain-containing protein [Anseongella ginsenosidimutans]TCS84647.1 hypothetical protein EDD80_12013 [Anseongella ginsenosidimutans]
MTEIKDKPSKKYFFIDESGDPLFYGHRKKLLISTEGFQPYLIIGMIETSNRKALRKAVVDFMENIKTDVMYNSIPSVIDKRGWYVHARGDHPEIRAKFFELLRSLDGFKAHLVIAKKELTIFNRKYNNNSTEFYFDVLHHLLNGKLNSMHCHHWLYLSQRGNNNLRHFEKAVNKALEAGKAKNTNSCTYQLELVPSNEMPELSIIDYMIWAVQRKLLKGESRYYDALKHKYEEIIDLYSK